MQNTRLMRVRDDLTTAMKTGEITPRGVELHQMACDLVCAAHPEAPVPERLDAFSLLVEFAAGAAVQKYEQA